MGQLVSQPIKTLFNGVSRQPHSVRLTSQVEEADNVWLSVVSGGFERRASGRHIATLEGLSIGDTHAVHVIDRDSREQYIVTFSANGLTVHDAITGEQKVVNAPKGFGYLQADDPRSDFAAVSIADYTVIVNRKVLVDLKPNPEWTEVAGNTGSAIGDMTGGAGLSALFDDDPDTSATKAAATEATGGKDFGTALTITRAVVTGVEGAEGAYLEYSDNNNDWSIAEFQSVTDGELDFWFGFEGSAHRYWRVRFVADDPATIAADGIKFYQVSNVKGTKQKFTDLPTTASTGEIWKVAGDATTLDDYYVRYEADGTWVETVNPASKNYFDETTMPHVLIREVDGTFTFEPAKWNSRPVGNETLIEAPRFVGKPITDVFFHKNRMGVLSDEYVIFSQAGDLFNFWPDKATEVLDSDPIDKAVTTSRVSLLKWAVPFRQSVFVTAEKAQFEVAQVDNLTPKTASIDLTTTYRAVPNCRPVAMGDSLYFASDDGTNGIVFEYYYDDKTISNTASNIAKHCSGYVPKNIVQFAADPDTGTLFTLSADVPNAVYVYNVYWSGEEKAQSAWSRWLLGDDACIEGIAVLAAHLVLLVKRGNGFFLEKIKIGPGDHDEGLGFDVKLDRRVELTGVYDAGTDTTTWELPYEHGDDIVGIFSGHWPLGTRGWPVRPLSYPDATKVRAVGDWSAHPVIFGKEMLTEVELSKQYLRNEQESARIDGRLQLKRMTFNYVDAGYFEVAVTPEARPEKVKAFTGRRIGNVQNVIGPVVVSSKGTFRVPINSRGDTVTIKLRSSSYLPFTISSLVWTGFYNEITAQE